MWLPCNIGFWIPAPRLNILSVLMKNQWVNIHKILKAIPGTSWVLWGKYPGIPSASPWLSFLLHQSWKPKASLPQLSFRGASRCLEQAATGLLCSEWSGPTSHPLCYLFPFTEHHKMQYCVSSDPGLYFTFYSACESFLFSSLWLPLISPQLRRSKQSKGPAGSEESRYSQPDSLTSWASFKLAAGLIILCFHLLLR